MALPLDGVRVLDLSRVLAAPLATQWLADLGADVVKVERPGTGDESRTYGPPFQKAAEGDTSPPPAAFYLSCNRNKSSITINHASPEGQALIRELATQSDVFVENFRTGTLAKYGLDYDSLRAINPRLVYLSVTGFGQTGPNAMKPGYDGIFQAMCGLMSTSGHPHEPMKVGISMVDILTSLFAGIAVLAALRHRDATGEGQFIDLALFDCGLASLSHFAMNYLVSGQVPMRRGNGGFGGVPSQAFSCSDRPLFLVAGNDAQFRALCDAIDLPELGADPRFASTSVRIQNRDDLVRRLGDRFAMRTRDEWLARLDEHDVPAGPVNELPDVLSSGQVRERNLLVEGTGTGDVLRLLANPIRLSSTPICEYRAPPRLGEQTESVLRERLGKSLSDLERLRSAGVI